MAKTKHKTTERNRGRGRPAKFTDAADLEASVERYFRSIKRSRTPPTLSGLSAFLDFADYSSFKDYEGNKKFSHVLKKARLRIRAVHEANLFSPSCTGSIFWLKCQAQDMFKESAQQHEHSGPGGAPLNVTIDWGVPPDEDPQA